MWCDCVGAVACIGWIISIHYPPHHPHPTSHYSLLTALLALDVEEEEEAQESTEAAILAENEQEKWCKDTFGQCSLKEKRMALLMTTRFWETMEDNITTVLRQAARIRSEIDLRLSQEALNDAEQGREGVCVTPSLSSRGFYDLSGIDESQTPSTQELFASGQSLTLGTHMCTCVWSMWTYIYMYIHTPHTNTHFHTQIHTSTHTHTYAHSLTHRPPLWPPGASHGRADDAQHRRLLPGVTGPAVQREKRPRSQSGMSMGVHMYI